MLPVALALAVLGLGACSSDNEPDTKPTEAHIRVEGTAPGALELVVSTDFFEDVDDMTGEVFQVFNESDTTSLETLPHTRVVQLTDLGSIVVELTNHLEEPAQVRLRVELDSNQEPFDRTATMSEGGTLRYVFVFLPRQLSPSIVAPPGIF